MSPAMRREAPFLISFAVALGIHATAAAFFVLSPTAPGAGHRPTKAISLNLVETLIVESPISAETEETVTDDMEVSPEEGSREDSAPSPPQKKSQEDDNEAKAGGQDETKTEDVKPRQQRKRESRPSKAAKKGGVKARGKSAKKKSAGQTSASPGSVNNYAARVRARIARNKPRGLRQRGTTVVSFGVSRSGGLRYARLVRSSGSSSLDSAAIAAVRRSSPFPAPPRGASLRQLSFTIPFNFR